VAPQTPTKSKTPFAWLLIVVVAAGAGGIYYKTRSDSAPSVPVPALAAPSANPNLPPAEGYLEGKADAPVQILEFADFECPGCGQFATKTEPEVRKRMIETGQVSIRYFDFPLPMHPNTMSASLAAACAADQGKFWEMHDMLFAEQSAWNGHATSNPKAVFQTFLPKLGLDAAAWNSCFDTQKDVPRIEAHRNAGVERGVNGTPTFIIGGQMYFEVFEYSRLKPIVDSLLKAKSDAPAKP
jgi:protein-disulfide isomerase